MNGEVRTVEAVYGILVEYTSICVETFAAGNIAAYGVEQYCTVQYTIHSTENSSGNLSRYPQAIITEQMLSVRRTGKK